MENLNEFQKIFFFMGPWKWIMMFMALIVIILIGIKVYDLLIKRNGKTRYVNAIIFWGGVTALLGIISQLSGFWMVLNEIMKSPDISPPLLLTGYLSSFVTPLFGLFVFLASAICWWALKNSSHLVSGK